MIFDDSYRFYAVYRGGLRRRIIGQSRAYFYIAHGHALIFAGYVDLFY